MSHRDNQLSLTPSKLSTLAKSTHNHRSGRKKIKTRLGIHLAERDFARQRPWAPWPESSDAEAAFFQGEQAEAERISRALFGRPLQKWEYAGLGGTPDSGTVEIGVSSNRLYLEIRDPVAASYCGHYYVTRAVGRLVLINEGLHIRHRKLRGCGLGLQMFYRQVRSGVALGLDRIDLCAGRRADENGYYTWPRFGFDGILSAHVRSMLPVGLRSVATVLDLMEIPDGRSWWRERGVSLEVSFSLRPGSRSLITLQRYVAAKMERAGGPKRNLEMAMSLSYRKPP